MREKEIEAHFVRRVKDWIQGMAYKFTSPGRRNVPDRLCLAAVPEEHRALVARYVRFVELKAEGEKPTAGQRREHKRLRELGFRVDVVDSKAQADDYVGEWME